jgi:hypothetical protein
MTGAGMRETKGTVHVSERRFSPVYIAVIFATAPFFTAPVRGLEIGSIEGIRKEQSLPSRQRRMQRRGQAAGLPESVMTGGSAIAADKPQPERGVWLAFETEPEIVTRKEADQVTAAVDGDSVTYTIISPGGISGATISPNKGWPKRVVVRLRLRGLESFTASNGRVNLRASVLSHGGHRRLLYVTDGGEEKKVGKDSPYWTQIKALDGNGKPVAGLPDKTGWFEIELPSALFYGKPKSLTLGWIDFYR